MIINAVARHLNIFGSRISVIVRVERLVGVWTLHRLVLMYWHYNSTAIIFVDLRERR